MHRGSGRLSREVSILAAKLFVLATPFFALIFVEAFVLPNDFLTFRCWEALSVRSIKWAFPGPLYPNQNLTRLETGDLGNGTKHAVSREVTWQTDEYGFRNRESRQGSSLDIVIVGDSFVAGTGMSQDQILPEVLERDYGLKSYGYAPSNMKSFIRDPRFSEQLPKIVVVAVTERSLSRLSAIGNPATKTRQWFAELGMRHPLLISGIDRLVAPGLFRFAHSRLKPEPHPVVLAEGEPGVLFFAAQKPDSAVTTESCQRFLSALREYHQRITSRGSKFLFVMIPDKEYVYATSLPSKRWPSIIPDLVRNLVAEGIPVVDLSRPFLKARAEDSERILYQPDDTHWSATGVELAARLIHDEVTRISNLSEQTVSR